MRGRARESDLFEKCRMYTFLLCSISILGGGLMGL